MDQTLTHRSNLDDSPAEPGGYLNELQRPHQFTLPWESGGCDQTYPMPDLKYGAVYNQRRRLKYQ